jgi:hypothetical protein
VDVYARQARLEAVARENALAAEIRVRDDADGATVEARLALNDEAYLVLHEWLEDADGDVRRRKYGYRFVERGKPRWGYDLDPSHEPPAHRHGSGKHEREAASRVAVEQVIEEAWETSSRQAESIGARGELRRQRDERLSVAAYCREVVRREGGDSDVQNVEASARDAEHEAAKLTAILRRWF